MGRIVGIDLGTTYSLIAIVEDSRPRTLADDQGRVLLPSVVHYSRQAGIEVGYQAMLRLASEPCNTVYSVKRLMGKGRQDLRQELELLPFRVAQGEGVVRIQLDQREFTPPELSAVILRHLRQRAERLLGESINEAVITVPAYFDDSQRQATRDAGRIAGLEVLRIVNEPTAAALAYGLDKRGSSIVAVYDFGGGTFDITILQLKDGVFEVHATAGDTHLGGDDIDRVMLGIALEEIERSCGINLRSDPRALEELRRSAILAKTDLSAKESATFAFESLEQGVRYQRVVTRAEFETWIASIVERTLAACRQALRDARLQPGQIDEVVLVGGSTRIPLVRRRVEELFGRKPHTDLNPDEVVALGAAVQADILAGGRTDMLLLDVIPLSLGIETMGGVVSKLIHRNSTIPASAVEYFTTFADNQTGVDIHVVQGERELVQDCRSLGRFILKGIPPMAAGLPRVEVHFQVDANGILSVTARELRTGLEASIEVRPSYGLTDEEVERMLFESFEYAEEDVRIRLAVEARLEAETTLRALEKVVKTPAYRNLEGRQQREIEDASRQLHGVLDAADHHVIQDKLAHLNSVTHELAEQVMNEAVRKVLTDRDVEEVFRTASDSERPD